MRKLLGRLEHALLAIATASLVVMMVLISVDAIGRHLFSAPLRGTLEFVSLYPMAILVFATLSYNYRENGHVRLDVLNHALRARLGRHYSRAIALICLPVFAYLTWNAGAEALGMFLRGETRMGAISWPVYLSYGWVAVGAGTLTLRLVLDVIAPETPVEAGEARPDRG